MTRPICIDLFSGVGGLSLGFEQAGFDIACAVEIDPVHAAAHRYNFPETPIIRASVEGITGAEIKQKGEIANKKIDVVVGGSPCQGFSMIGKRSLDDPRNSLVLHFMRIVTELDASYFVLENVKGLTVGKHRKFLDEVVDGFQQSGFDVLLPWKVLNSAWFGVPQHRERLFIIGAKRGLPLPHYPEAIFQIAGNKKPTADLPFGPNVFDALSDLPDAEVFPELLATDSVETNLGSPSAYSAVLRGLIVDPENFSYDRVGVSNIMTSSMRSSHNAVTRRRFNETEHGKVEPVSRFLKLDPNGVCNTLRAGTGQERGGFTAARPIHPFYDRCITVREMARLHSYPDWFRFNWTKWHGAREVGNSVPPLLARAVAKQIIQALGVRPEKPLKKLTLDNEGLLKVSTNQALKIRF